MSGPNSLPPAPPPPRPELRARVLAYDLLACAAAPPRDLTALRARLATALAALLEAGRKPAQRPRTER